jgi:hypothetical protein
MSANSKINAASRVLVRGPVILRMDIGQSLPTSAGFDLTLRYVEDGIALLSGGTEEQRQGLWTPRSEHRGYYFMVGIWPWNVNAEQLNDLLDAALANQRAFDGVIDMLKTGRFSLEEGRA